MNRRKFIAATGVGVGVAGCLTDEGPGEGDDASDDEGDATLDGGDDTGNETPDSSDSSADGAEGGSDESAADRSESDESGESDAEGDGDDGGEPEDGNGDEEGDADPSERTTAFESCTRATVSGPFADGDVAYASTTFYQDGLVGDTLLEDGITFGEDVEAPFSGTVVFEIGDESAVTEEGDEIVVTVPDYGNDGTVISGLTTEPTDYRIGGITTPNPDADDCLAEIEPDADADDGGEDGGEGESGVNVSITDATTPIDAGDSFEMTVRLENPGDSTATDDVALLVGNSRERVESRTVTLEGGERRRLSLGYETPPVDNDQTFPVRVETSDDADERSVTVHGTE